MLQFRYVCCGCSIKASNTAPCLKIDAPKKNCTPQGPNHNPEHISPMWAPSLSSVSLFAAVQAAKKVSLPLRP
jgi:hypothetical protein